MRKAIITWIGFGAVFGIALFLYALLIEPKQLKVREIAIGKGDPVATFVLMADLHVGGLHVGPERTSQIIARINSLNPDYVLLPGDLINGHEPRGLRSFEEARSIDTSLARLGDLVAPRIASLGNHDNWYGSAYIRTKLETAGFRVLENASFREAGYCFVGIADADTAHPTTAGFADCGQDDAIIVLMHSPDTRHLLRSDTTFAVAGHTHGGQVNLPGIGRAVTSTQCGKPCAYGLIQSDPPLFVSAGIGTSILPIRFRSPPEIVKITLKAER